jgi:hypothetical protein
VSQKSDLPYQALQHLTHDQALPSVVCLFTTSLVSEAVAINILILAGESSGQSRQVFIMKSTTYVFLKAHLAVTALVRLYHNCCLARANSGEVLKPGGSET